MNNTDMPCTDRSYSGPFWKKLFPLDWCLCAIGCWNPVYLLYDGDDETAISVMVVVVVSSSSLLVRLLPLFAALCLYLYLLPFFSKNQFRIFDIFLT